MHSVSQQQQHMHSVSFLETVDREAAPYGLSHANFEPSVLDLLKADEASISQQLPRLVRLNSVNKALQRRGLEPLSLPCSRQPIPSVSVEPLEMAIKYHKKPKPKKLTAE